MRIAALACLCCLPLGAQSDVAFPPAVYAARRARLLDQVKDAAIVVPGRYLVGEEGLWKQDPNFWYLTGVESPYAILLLTPKRTMLFLPGEFQFAGAQFPIDDPRFRRARWNRPPRRLAPGKAAQDATGVPETYALDEFLPRLRDAAADWPRLAVPWAPARAYAPPGLPEALTLQQQFARSLGSALSAKDPLNVAPVLERLRLVKDPAEIAVMREAARISGEGLIAAMKAARPGLKDREIAGLMEYTWKRLGAQRASFPPVVASGPAAMTLFTVQQEDYNAGDRVMQAGDLLFMDYGAAEYNTYATDICRTIPVSGRFTPVQRRYYDIVLEAQLAAIDSVKPGIDILDAIRAAARVFRQHGLEQYEDIGRMGADRVWGIMPSPTYYLAKHGGLVPYSARGLGVRDLGHHIGLEVQDSRDYSQPLQPGMIFTMEPKLYIPDETIAIMIEDMILVTENGREVLSRAVPKKAEEIERLMRRR